MSTRARELPWTEVLRPGRGLVYRWLAVGAPALGRQLHNSGWAPHGMVPFGHGAPVFDAADRRKGAYAVGGRGVVEFGSPLLAMVEAWSQVLAARTVLDWGGVAFHVDSVEVIDPPEFASGVAVMRTATPVVMKGSGQDGSGARVSRQAWVLPREPEFDAYFVSNLRRKAETLGLDPAIVLERVTWVGPKRSFHAGKGLKVGAAVEVALRGAPETLRAVWSWGLGQANSAGFGWVTAA